MKLNVSIWYLGISAVLLFSFQNCAGPLPDVDSANTSSSTSAAPADPDPFPTPTATPTAASLTYFYMTPLNSHISGGGGCPAGTGAGSIADSGAGQTLGNQIFCLSNQTVSYGSTVITDIKVTAPAANVPACPAGYTSQGTIENCELGVCNAVESVCAKLESLSATTPTIQGFYLTPEGAHVADSQLTCSAGYVSAGEVTDCGGGTCAGHQLFCIKH